MANFYKKMGTGVCIATMAMIMILLATIQTPQVLVAQELQIEVNITMSTTLAEEMVADIAKDQDTSSLNKLTYATIGAAAMFLGQKLYAYAKALGDKMRPAKRCKEPCEIGSPELYPCPHHCRRAYRHQGAHRCMQPSCYSGRFEWDEECPPCGKATEDSSNDDENEVPCGVFPVMEI